MAPPLTDPFHIGPVRIPNRVVLAPLAGIGNWFVRLQAKRYGAGLAVSEMVSSFGVHHRNDKTVGEMLRIHPDERAGGRGPVSIQLFGQDPEVMRSAAATVAERGADLIDLNMGCPVPKVCKTGAGAALIKDPDTAVAVARAARATATATPGSRISAAPAPVFMTLGTGQPMLRSMRSAPSDATCAAAERMTSGSCPKSWIATVPSSGWIRNSSWWVLGLP